MYWLRVMGALLLGLLLVHTPNVLATVSNTGFSADRTLHWQRLYGDSIEFQVWRDGEQVGSYRTLFNADSEELQIETQMELEISWLWWRYRYQYQATEFWRQGRLEKLNSSIDDNGDFLEHRFYRRGDRLIGGNQVPEAESQQDPAMPNDAESVALPVLASHHYNIAVLDQGRVLNTLTGRVNSFEIEPLGIMWIDSAGGKIEARGFRYQGELHDTDVWYDSQDRWVGLRFLDRRGATMEFRCKRCGSRASSSKSMIEPSTYIQPPIGQVIVPTQMLRPIRQRWQL